MNGSTMLIMPDDGVSVWQILLAEFIFTFLLAAVVIMVCTPKRTANHGYRGAAIGLTVFVGIMCVGSISGGVFNPAVAFGPIIVDLLDGGISISYLRMYLVATLAGGAAAG